jgi:hypothetical protein
MEKSKIEKEEKNALNQEIDDIRAILASKEGKRVMWRILEYCGLYRNSFAPQAKMTDFNCGVQSVAQWLIDECISANPKATGDLIINKLIDECISANPKATGDLIINNKLIEDKND